MLNVVWAGLLIAGVVIYGGLLAARMAPRRHGRRRQFLRSAVYDDSLPLKTRLLRISNGLRRVS